MTVYVSYLLLPDGSRQLYFPDFNLAVDWDGMTPVTTILKEKVEDPDSGFFTMIKGLSVPSAVRKTKQWLMTHALSIDCFIQYEAVHIHT